MDRNEGGGGEQYIASLRPVFMLTLSSLALAAAMPQQAPFTPFLPPSQILTTFSLGSPGLFIHLSFPFPLLLFTTLEGISRTTLSGVKHF